ncbi:MAG: alpha/beta hydrolase [Anaerolineales bacterium]
MTATTVGLPTSVGPAPDSFYDFGGEGPPLHFANANGYPPGAYAPLIAALRPHYHVTAHRGRPLQPGSNPQALRSWEPLVDELVAHLEAAGARGWLGVGHSLGAILTAAAALRRPEFFSALVLIEPVFFSPPRMWLYGWMHRLGLVRHFHPMVPVARRRRSQFRDTQEMFERYRPARVFREIDDAGLRAYIDSLAVPTAEGVELAFPPAWEAQIYETGPFNLWGQLSRLRPPLLVIRAAETNAFEPKAVTALQSRLPQATIHQLDSGTHLIPLEQPTQIADLIHAFAQQHAPERIGTSA